MASTESGWTNRGALPAAVEREVEHRERGSRGDGQAWNERLHEPGPRQYAEVSGATVVSPSQSHTDSVERSAPRGSEGSALARYAAQWERMKALCDLEVEEFRCRYVIVDLYDQYASLLEQCGSDGLHLRVATLQVQNMAVKVDRFVDTDADTVLMRPQLYLNALDEVPLAPQALPPMAHIPHLLRSIPAKVLRNYGAVLRNHGTISDSDDDDDDKAIANYDGKGQKKHGDEKDVDRKNRAIVVVPLAEQLAKEEANETEKARLQEEIVYWQVEVERASAALEQLHAQVQVVRPVENGEGQADDPGALVDGWGDGTQTGADPSDLWNTGTPDEVSRRLFRQLVGQLEAGHRKGVEQAQDAERLELWQRLLPKDWLATAMVPTPVSRSPSALSSRKNSELRKKTISFHLPNETTPPQPLRDEDDGASSAASNGGLRAGFRPDWSYPRSIKPPDFSAMTKALLHDERRGRAIVEENAADSMLLICDRAAYNRTIVETRMEVVRYPQDGGRARNGRGRASMGRLWATRGGGKSGGGSASAENEQRAQQQLSAHLELANERIEQLEISNAALRQLLVERRN